ncbi:MAG TPA: helix-hairpin-helix domain-containing protein [Pirellulales bacterium]
MVSQARPTTAPFATLDNREVAAALNEVARLLQRQSDNPFRIAAYRRAANQVQRMGRPICEIYHESGIEALRDLPGIGDSLARSLAELLETGQLQLLDRLRQRSQGEPLLATLPGVGAGLAQRIRSTLGVATLEELEAAAYDGRLRRVPGLGAKRIGAIRESLAARLQRMPDKRFRQPASAEPNQPPVSELLDLDREYRQLADQRRLPQAAPRRFNPTGAAWLPVWHAERGGRRFTVLYSNTARAHEAEATHDWVVIYRDDQPGAGQWTVITAGLGPLHGRRIVRGREAECREHYRQKTAQQDLPF